jgi:hypothetical protein
MTRCKKCGRIKTDNSATNEGDAMMEKIVEIIPDDMPKWARDAMERGQLWLAVFDEIKKLKQRANEVERDRAKCLQLFNEYYTMNLVGNKQEFSDAHAKARRYLEAKKVETNTELGDHAEEMGAGEVIE